MIRSIDMPINLRKSPDWNLNRGVRTVGTTGQMRLQVPPAAPTVVTSGLVLYLDAGNASSYPGSGTTWTDLSGNGNNVTLVNSPTWNSIEGFTFNGINQYGTLPMSGFPSGAGARTSSVWFKPLGNASVQKWVLSYGNSSTAQIFATGAANGFVFLGGFNYDYQTGYGISSGTRYHVAFAFNGTTLSAYVNGSFLSSTSFSSLNTVLTEANIGRLSAPYGQYFEGSTSEVMLYNRALSASEILQNYNVTKTRYGL